MRDNARIRERFELSLDGKQVSAIVVGALVLVAGTFVLGMSLGRHLSPRSEASSTAPQPPLARLDDPLPVAAQEEPPPALEAHDALVGPLEKALPVPPMNPPGVQLTEARSSTATPASASGSPTSGSPTSGSPTSGSAPTSASTSSSAGPNARPSAALAATGSALPTPPAAEPPRAEPGRETVPAARPKAQRAAASVAAAKGAYTIQIGSSSRRADAERLAKRFESRRSRVIVADVPGKGRWYRVQVGSYATRDAASSQLASLARSGVRGIVTAVR